MGQVGFELHAESTAVLTLEGGDRLNVFDLEMREALIEALAAAREHPDVQALVLRAEGPNFSAGADLREFGTAADPYEARWIRWRRDPWLALWEMPCPTIASLHGIAMGSGLEMALLCDIRICTPDTRLALPETRLGMLPAACGTQSLSRAIGTARALGLVISAAELPPQEAVRIGVVHRLTEDADGDALQAAVRLAGLPGAGAAARALRAASDLPLAAGLEVECHAATLARGDQR
jgi:enoyl-CoA hydratase/carnithine racemase